MLEILVRHRLDVERSVGIVDPLPFAQLAAGLDDRDDARPVDPLHAQRDRAVGEIDALADLDVAREPGVRHADEPVVTGHLFGGEGEGGAVFEPHRNGSVGEGARAHLGAGQILEDRDVHAELARDAANVGDDRGVILVRAVREVEPHDVDPGEEQRAQHRRIARRGADGRDDLRAFRWRLHRRAGVPRCHPWSCTSLDAPQARSRGMSGKNRPNA